MWWEVSSLVMHSWMFCFAEINLDFTLKCKRMQSLFPSAHCLNCVICKFLSNRCAVALSVLSVLSIPTLLVIVNTVKVFEI